MGTSPEWVGRRGAAAPWSLRSGRRGEPRPNRTQPNPFVQPRGGSPQLTTPQESGGGDAVAPPPVGQTCSWWTEVCYNADPALPPPVTGTAPVAAEGGATGRPRGSLLAERETDTPYRNH